MKRVLKCVNVLLLSACTGMVAQAKSVDETTAKKVGSNYLISDGTPGVNSPADLETAYVATGTVNSAVINDYYVFNIKGSTGFVMVSADDNITPILAASTESSFDINTMSPSAKSWITGYQNRITAAVANNIPAKAGVAAKWAALQTATAPHAEAARTTATITFPSSTQWLLKTKWDQMPVYNTYCPGTGSSSSATRTVTGCVATCMSEVMQYWSWPTVGTGAHVYTDPTYGVLSADFGNTAYNWTSMAASLNAGNTAIATLMYQAGIAVDMTYGLASADGSGSYVIGLESPVINCAEFALKTYFHYKPSLKGIPRYGEAYMSGSSVVYYVDSMSESAWITMLKAEVTAQRPVMYSGSGADGGHCWVCDGYNSSSMMHFNFGWSGTSNGFYTVDDIAPPALGTGGGSTGNNFNNDQCAVVGIMPDSFPNTVGNIKMLAHLDCPFNSPGDYGQAATVTTKILNSNTTTFKGSVCVQVYDTNNVLVFTMDSMASPTITAGDSASLTFTSTGLYRLIPESYYSIRCMYRATGATTWTAVANNGTFINYNIISVINDTDITLYDSLHVTTGHTMIMNRPLTVSTKVAYYASGLSTFNGSLEGVMINVATGTSYTVQTLTTSIPANNYVSATFTNAHMAVPAGTYAFAVKHEKGSGGFVTTGSDYYENPVIITVKANVGVASVNSSDKDILVYPNPASNVVNVSLEGNTVSSIRITNIEGREVANVVPGTQQVVSIPTGNFAPGIYFVIMQTGDDQVVKKIVVTK